MSIQVAQLRETCASTLGASGVRFDTHFLMALNSVIGDFNRQCNTDQTVFEQVSGDIDLDFKHFNTFYMGCINYLQLSAEWARQPDAEAESKYRRSLAMSQFEEYQDQDLEAGIPEGSWGSSG